MAGQKLPISLVLVSWLFILSGVLAVISTLAAVAQGGFVINLGILGLFVGPGLLRLRRGWRTCALVLLWLTFIVLALVALVFTAAPGPLQLHYFGRPAGNVPKGVGLLLVLLIFVLTYWPYRVLTRSDIRALFGLVP